MYTQPWAWLQTVRSIPVAGQRTHGTTFRALKESFHVATAGAESAVCDCLVIIAAGGVERSESLPGVVTNVAEFDFADRSTSLSRDVTRSPSVTMTTFTMPTSATAASVLVGARCHWSHVLIAVGLFLVVAIVSPTTS